MTTDVCIVGAGPAGLVTAMKLNQLGIKCVLVDKDRFPRDKVCGECFDGRVYHVLNRIDPNFIPEMEQEGIILKSWNYGFGDYKGRSLQTNFDPKATPRLLSKRTDFDGFLMQKTKKMPNVKVLEGVELASSEQVEDGVILKSKDNSVCIKTKIVIGATGANAKFRNTLTSKNKKGNVYIFIRAYFKNVAPIPNNEVRFHIFYAPTVILYVCPLPNGIVSVEVGGQQDALKKANINLREKLFELLATYPPIKKQFENAEMTEKIKGAAIQLSYRKEQLSGVRFLLVGSASASVNPVTGFGVGHAMAAGETAAFTIAKALENDDFSAKALKSYDKALYKRLKNELLMSQILTYIFDHPALCLPTLFRVGHSITSALTHKDFSDEFLNPIFYLKTAFNHKIARYE